MALEQVIKELERIALELDRLSVYQAVLAQFQCLHGATIILRGTIAQLRKQQN